MPYVRETAAAKAISAFVILAPGTRDYVATVNFHFTPSRVVMNLWQTDEAAKRSAAFANANRGAVPVKHPTDTGAYPFHPLVTAPKKGADYQPRDFIYQESRAGGYGYDKKTAAGCGAVVDGIPLTDHCSRYGAPVPPVAGRYFPHDFVAPKGYTLANWIRVDHSRDVSYRNPADLDDGFEGYTDCYRDSGLGVLVGLGYTIHQAI